MTRARHVVVALVAALALAACGDTSDDDPAPRSDEGTSTTQMPTYGDTENDGNPPPGGEDRDGTDPDANPDAGNTDL